MKTIGVTFQNALKALNDNKCIGIRPKNHIGDNYYTKDKSNRLIYLVPSTGTFLIETSFTLFRLLGKWNLVMESIPVPKTEKRIFNYWVVVWPDGTVETYDVKPPDAVHNEAQHVFRHSQGYTFTYPEEEEQNEKIQAKASTWMLRFNVVNDHDEAIELIKRGKVFIRGKIAQIGTNYYRVEKSDIEIDYHKQ